MSKKPYFLTENDFWIAMPALEPVNDRHVICVPRNGHRGLLRCGTVLYQEGVDLIYSIVDQFLSEGASSVFMYEEVNPSQDMTHVNGQTSTEKYIHLLAVESDFYGAFRYLQEGWYVEKSLFNARKSYSHGGYQMAGLFTPSNHEIVVRPLKYALPDHYFTKMTRLFFGEKADLKLLKKVS